LQKTAIEKDERKRGMADIINALTGRPAEERTYIDSGMTVSNDPNDPTVNQTGTAGRPMSIKWDEQKADPNRAIARALGNEETAGLGMNILQNQQMGQRFEAQAGLQREMNAADIAARHIQRRGRHSGVADTAARRKLSSAVPTSVARRTVAAWRQVSSAAPTPVAQRQL
jgi:hypothetical protein